MIRRAIETDLPALLEMGRKFHGYAQVHEIPFDAPSFRQTIEHGLQDERQAYFVADSDGLITGMTAGLVYPSYFNHKVLTGQELFWWSEGSEGRALYRALEQWAREHGCLAFTMIALGNGNAERMGRVYERMGYRPLENSFIKGF